jgi:outer membrane protein OmpA-like peptidoglycan-associated protein
MKEDGGLVVISTLYSLFFLVALSASSAPASQQKDVKDCADHPLFTRMSGYWIQYCNEKEYDEYAFEVGNGRKETIGGHLWTLRYRPQANQKIVASRVQIHQNFENAVATLGGTVVSSQASGRTLRVARGGTEYWIDLRTDHTGMYIFTIVQREELAQTIEASAEVFSNGLKSTGHAAVYGIFFDTGKADLKTESAQAIGEIAKLLKADPSLKIFVVGHTDNVGTLESNMRLSQSRADAVVASLMGTHGIAAARLKAFGSGPYSPVASNDAESGRAKNRRVELVKQ